MSRGLNSCSLVAFLYLALTLALSSAGVVEDIQDCGSDGFVIKVEVTNCTRQPCILVKNRTYDIVIDFIPANTSAVLDLGVTASITIIEIPIIVPGNANGCPGLAFGCPIQENVFQRHTTSLNISGDYFERDAVITFKLINEDGDDEVCIKANVIIQAA